MSLCFVPISDTFMVFFTKIFLVLISPKSHNIHVYIPSSEPSNSYISKTELILSKCSRLIGSSPEFGKRIIYLKPSFAKFKL